MSQDPTDRAPGAPGVARRDLLKVGAASAVSVGAAGSGGCAALDAWSRTSAGGLTAPLTDTEMSQWCKRLDLGLATIEHGKSLSHLLPGVDLTEPAQRAEAKRVDRLGRKVMRGLTFASLYTSLPEASREHPEVVKRVALHQPELDEAVLCMTAELEAQTPEENAALQRELKREPDIPLRLAALFEAAAQELGVPPQSRKQMKRIMGTVGWRLGRQSPTAVFDEYVTKVKKLAGRSGQLEEYKRTLATVSLERQLWAQGRVPVAALSADAEEPDPPRAPSTKPRPKPPLESERRRQQRRASRELTAGGLVLGVGLATFGAGTAATFGLGLAPVGLALMTVGGVILLAGIITLIVGAVRRAKHRPK